MDHGELKQMQRRVAGVAGASLLALTTWIATGILPTDLGSLSVLLLVTALFIGLAVVAYSRASPLVSTCAGLVAAQFAIVLPVIGSTYVAMRFNAPLADATLYRWDQAIGFDWDGFVAFVDARPLLAETLGHAYTSFSYQTFGLPLLLALGGHIRMAHAFIVAFALACLLSSAIAVFFPAYGAYIHLGYQPADLDNINIFFAYQFVEQFDAVRTDPGFVLRGDAMAGILTFPSVHAATAFVLAWAAWPSRWLRWPFLVLNLLMALSAISHGSHYAVDVLASVPVAAAAILAARLLVGTEEAPRRIPASPVTPAASPA